MTSASKGLTDLSTDLAREIESDQAAAYLASKRASSPILISAISLSLVVGYLNSEGEYAPIATRLVKGLALVFVVLASLNSLRARGSMHTPRASASILAAVTAIFFILIVTSAFNSATFNDWVLLIQAAIQVGALVVLVRDSTYGPVFSVLVAAVSHCVLAILGGAKETSDFFAGRASGGSHPILIGFAALVVIGLAPMVKRPLLAVAIGTVGLYAMYLSFSRTSILGLLAAALLWLILHQDRTLAPRVLLLLAFSILGVRTFITNVANVLAQGQLEGLYGGTGRGEIWTRLWGIRDVFFPFGIGLGDPSSPNPKWHQIEIASLGAPAENSFLQAAIYGGVLGVLALATLIGTTTVLVVITTGFTWTGLTLVCALWSAALTTSGLAGFGFQFAVLAALGLTYGSLSKNTERRAPKPSVRVA